MVVTKGFVFKCSPHFLRKGIIFITAYIVIQSVIEMLLEWYLFCIKLCFISEILIWESTLACD